MGMKVEVLIHAKLLNLLLVDKMHFLQGQIAGIRISHVYARFHVTDIV